jgi:hypothetical protein
MSAKGLLILLTGCAALGGLAWLHSQRTPSAAPAGTAEAAHVVEPASPRTSLSPAESGFKVAAVVPAIVAPPLAVAVEAPEAGAVLAQIEEHFAAGDAGSLRRIAEQLRHPQPQVRLAAREALRDANDLALLPDIQFELEAAADPQEAAELQELVDYLQLPSYTELKNSSAAATTPRVERQRVTAPLRAGRAAASAPSDAAPAANAMASTSELLAQLQAENQRLKQENAELRSIVTPLVAQ